MNAETKKILLIEDDANLLAGLEAKLRVAGYQTMTDMGVDKSEIFGKIKLLKPDYIILDAVLPQIDGFAAVCDIKADPETAKIPLFVFADLSESSLKQRCQKYGVEVYLLKKEFNLDEFVAKFIKISQNLSKINV